MYKSEEDLKGWDTHSTFMALSIFMILAGSVSFIFFSWKICIIILVSAGLMMYKGIKMMSSEAYNRVNERQNEYVEAYPACAVTFTNNAS